MKGHFTPLIDLRLGTDTKRSPGDHSKKIIELAKEHNSF